MKTMIFSILSLGLTLSFAACSDDDNPVITDRQLDQTTTYFTRSEPDSYFTYYKPQVGYVGDPMPFFDPVSKEFRILYLQDWRDGAATFHPIHCVATKDAASYISFGEAIPCGALTEQDPAIGTGGTIYADGTYYTFYTGHKFNYKGDQKKEVLMLATSADCRTWTKDHSFRLEAPEGYNPNEFRDPHVFRDEDAGLYRMVVSAIRNGKSVIAHFTSTDLRNWTVQEPFFNNIWGRFYECPDVFKMGNYWYMIYSDKDETRMVQYFFAPTLAGLMGLPDSGYPGYLPREGKLEGTSFYAGKSASDGSDRYLWGWCATREGKDNAANADWAGALVAHKLVQNADGTLSLDVPAAINAKYTQAVVWEEKARTGEVSGNTSAYTLKAGASVRFGRLQDNNKIEMTVKAPGNSEAVFGVSFVDCTDRNVKYSLFIEARWNMLKLAKVVTDEETGEVTERKDITEVPFEKSADGTYRIKMYTEQSVCVFYVNDAFAFTNRVYDLPKNPWSVFCSDGEVTVSEIKLSTY
ncbi:glycoside hydrolase family 32 protein [Bacteroides sp. GM023]|uniref:glycoside hydrolase family 32 protein n=1 Tax=Bacteroides sp. GM023 TaxID=2723058 RepID=UPI00168AD3F0|nr:glycoside hydrolase family 32 protein [Bacteroides sp. GM023]MBD3587849.1 DUF4975 domain-containing protein [Bacteroides sp. GM023]